MACIVATAALVLLDVLAVLIRPATAALSRRRNRRWVRALRASTLPTSEPAPNDRPHVVFLQGGADGLCIGAEHLPADRRRAVVFLGRPADLPALEQVHTTWRCLPGGTDQITRTSRTSDGRTGDSDSADDTYRFPRMAAAGRTVCWEAMS